MSKQIANTHASSSAVIVVYRGKMSLRIAIVNTFCVYYPSKSGSEEPVLSNESVHMRRLSAILTAIFLVLAASRAFAAPEIIKVRYWAAPEHTRIVVDTSEEAVMTVDKSPRKISILFRNFRLSADVPAENVVNQPGLEKILAEAVQKDARIDLILTPGVEANIFKLQKIQDKPDRVVIDLTVPELEKKESEKRLQVKAKLAEKVKIIVIDPGHGGEDPGAIGRKKTREKDVVLQISQRLQAELNSREGYKAFLTRNGDYYPSFNKRLQIAREYGADLFVSIHADAARNRGARGGSVYCLSTSGASSAAARILARKENLADIIGGVGNGSGNTDESEVIMLNMIQTETINMSKTFGSIVLSNLNDINKIKFNRIQEAPFRVLKMPEIPSVLVETAYVSNPVEEQLLKSPGFQKKLALAVADSIVDFLSSDERTRPAIMASLNNAKKKSQPAKLEPAEEESSGKDEEDGEEPEPAAAAKKRKAHAAEPAQSAAKKPAKPAYTTYSVKEGRQPRQDCPPAQRDPLRAAQGKQHEWQGAALRQ